MAKGSYRDKRGKTNRLGKKIHPAKQPVKGLVGRRLGRGGESIIKIEISHKNRSILLGDYGLGFENGLCIFEVTLNEGKGQRRTKLEMIMNPVSGDKPRDTASACFAAGENRGGGQRKDPSALLMCAFFLGLASIAVVVVGGYFPWFILAPLLVFLMFVHVRRIEAKYRHEPDTVR